MRSLRPETVAPAVTAWALTLVPSCLDLHPEARPETTLLTATIALGGILAVLAAADGPPLGRKGLGGEMVLPEPGPASLRQAEGFALLFWAIFFFGVSALTLGWGLTPKAAAYLGLLGAMAKMALLLLVGGLLAEATAYERRWVGIWADRSGPAGDAGDVAA